MYISKYILKYNTYFKQIYLKNIHSSRKSDGKNLKTIDIEFRLFHFNIYYVCTVDCG